MKKQKQIALLGALCLALTGCTDSRVTLLKSYPLVDAVSTAEIRNYYKEAMKTKDLAALNPRIVAETMEYRDITPTEATRLHKEVGNIEKLLSQNSYQADTYLDKNTFEYMKILLDGYQYTQTGVAFEGAVREKYVIDVNYLGIPQTPGTVNLDAKYLGVHGVFRHDKDNVPFKDELYVEKIEKAVAEEQAKLSALATQGIVNAKTEQAKTSNLADYNELDLKVYNNVFGSSLNETAFVPTLDMVFTPAPTKQLGGYGIYPQGKLMNTFGIQSNKIKANATIRYIFTKDVADETIIHLTGVYLKSFGVEGLPEMTDDIFPGFVQSELSQIIERADRLITNSDITGLAKGNVLYNLRNTIYWGHLTNSAKISHLSDLTRSLKRDGTHYLVEVQTVSQDDVMYDNLGQGVYKETYLMLIEQQLLDDSFIIIDWLKTKRELVSEPTISFASSVDKRYYYLSLEGNTPEDLKPAIKQYYQDLLQSANTKEWTNYYNAIDHNTEMLSKTERDSIYLTTKAWCERMGSEKPYEYRGAITDWIGGTNQVEFTTEELVYYSSLDKGQWMQNYYVISFFEDKWVIDELKNLELKIITGDELAQKREEIKGYSTFNQDKAPEPLPTIVDTALDETTPKDTPESVQPTPEVTTEIAPDSVEPTQDSTADSLEAPDETTPTQD